LIIFYESTIKLSGIIAIVKKIKPRQTPALIKCGVKMVLSQAAQNPNIT